MLNYLIKDLKEDEKPREKLIKHGEEILTDYELLALIIRSGGKNTSALNLAKQVLDEHGGLRNLKSLNINSLLKIKHINVAKGASIKAACEFASRIFIPETSIKTPIVRPEDVYGAVKGMVFGKKKEHLILISLDARNKLISKKIISIGTINETLVHPREIFKVALIENAVSIILVHNHPSNNAQPSTEDIKVTEKVARGGLTMGIPLIDHIIACDEHFTSMKALNLFTCKPINKKGGDLNVQV